MAIDDRAKTAQMFPLPEPRDLKGPVGRRVAVLGCVLRGEMDRDTCRLLGMPKSTIRWHMSVLFKTFGVTTCSRRALVEKALQSRRPLPKPEPASASPPETRT